MSAQKVNYEELKPYIPQNGNEENYARLTQYLLMHMDYIQVSVYKGGR
ncbi:MAG: hypothetical protein IJ158_08740 [Treponema sp.]|nr:hypothetical protein [Treponema sp.]